MPEVDVWVAGYGFYERLTVRPLRQGEKPGKVICQVVDDAEREVVVDLCDELAESEFWPSREWDRAELLAWVAEPKAGLVREAR